MKTENKKPGMRYMYLVCLLLCALPTGAQGLGYIPKLSDPGGNASPCLVSSQTFPSEQHLSESLFSFYYQTSPVTGNDLNGKDKNLMFEEPEGGGIPLGTPVKEAIPFLILLVIVYGFISRFKTHPSN
jgi:hypothetical protein